MISQPKRRVLKIVNRKCRMVLAVYPARYLDFARHRNGYSRNRGCNKPYNDHFRRLLWHRCNIFLVLISLFQTHAVAWFAQTGLNFVLSH